MELFENWSITDTSLLTTSLLAIDKDIRSTKDFLDDGRKERNPLLGENPSDKDLQRAQIVSSALAAATAGVLKGKYRKAFLGAITSLHYQVAESNKKRANSSEGGSLWTDSKDRKKAIGAALMGAIVGTALDTLEKEKSVFADLFIDKKETKLVVTKKF